MAKEKKVVKEEKAEEKGKKARPEGVRDIGIAVATYPKEACNDDRCPFHGTLPIRGRLFTGNVVSDKAAGTVIVEWSFLQKIPKYQRFMRKKSRVAAHNPPCIKAREGDIVRIAECRPLSKTKHFVVIEKFEGKVQKEV